MLKIIIVHTTDLDDPTTEEAIYRSMPAKRRQKADACRHREDRLRSLGAGAALACGLSLASNSRSALFSNLSHSGNLAVCAIADTKVGIDVQMPTALKSETALIRRVCPPEEAAFLLALPEGPRTDTFLRNWTVRESCLKMTGEGFRVSPASLAVLSSVSGSAEEFTVLRNGTPVHADFYQMKYQKAWITVCVRKSPDGRQPSRNGCRLPIVLQEGSSKNQEANSWRSKSQLGREFTLYDLSREDLLSFFVQKSLCSFPK